MKPARRALIVTLMMLLLRRPVGLLLRTMMPGAATVPDLYYTALMVQECLLWLAPAMLLMPWRHDAAPMARRDAMQGATTAVLLGLSAQITLSAVTTVWCRATGCRGSTVLLPDNGGGWVLAVLALVIVPAVCEEAFFRGGVYRSLKAGLGSWTAFVVTTLLFALMHGSAAGLPAHLGVSLLCTLLMLRYDRVWLCVVMHTAYNGAALLIDALALPVSCWILAFSVILMLACVGGMLRSMPDVEDGKPLRGWELALCCAVIGVLMITYFV